MTNLGESTSTTPSRRLQIGVLISTIDGYFQREMLEGLRRKADKEGLLLFFIAGNNINAPLSFERQFNVVYDLCNGPQLDALISATGFLISHKSWDETVGFIDRFQHLPRINLNFEIPGCPSVTIDNRTGFRELLQHLIQFHGYTRLAFMQGTEHNQDSEERFAVYKDCLAEAGLNFDPKLVVRGNFNQFDGRVAMDELLDRHAKFDVLVAANDKMAQVAMAVAVERGLRIPQDFALTGFDDVLQLSKEGPPLTTINQPLGQQMAVAIDVLLAMLRGEDVPPVSLLPTRMVLRQSCGCLSHAGSVEIHQVDPQKRLDVHQSIIASLRLVPEEASRYHNYVVQLEKALVGGWTPFEERLSSIARECLTQSGDISPLQSLLLAMYRGILVDPRASLDTQQRYGEYLHKGQIILFRAHSIFNVRETGTEDQNDMILRQLGFLKRRMSSLNHDQLMNLIEVALGDFGIPTAYFALYEAPFTFTNLNESKLPERSKLIFSMTNGVRETATTQALFPTRNLVPDKLFGDMSHQVMALFPIFQYAEHYGYMILDLSTMPSSRMELIRDEISSHIITSVMMDELAKARDLLKMDLAVATGQNAHLEHIAARDELTGLYNRRGFFNLANQQIETGRGYPMMIIFADLDGLKNINDSFGHIEGDYAIRQASHLLVQTFRTQDIVCRLSGDEFVILSPHCTPHDLRSIKARVYQRFDAFNAQSDKPYKIACSLGYFVLKQDDKTPLENILSHADQYLYAEKKRRKARRES